MEGIGQLSSRALFEIGGLPVRKDILQLHRAHHLQADKSEEAEAALMHKQLCVSDDALHRKLGFA